LLEAAHAAPSVGLMQPTRFVLVRDVAVKTAVHGAFLRANREAAEAYEGERRTLYEGLKLEGILEAPQNLCVLCDRESAQGHGLGRQTMPETAVYSSVCAVQNLWLAARVEGIGVGWVSILDREELCRILCVPEHLTVVAYLCLGYVAEFAASPELERAGWESRRAVSMALDRCDEVGK
jgi:5,6-dimethylbenzimidazole synthase